MKAFPFDPIPPWIYTSGMFTQWSHATAKVYLGLLSFVNHTTRLAYPSLRKLMILTGISRTTISACLNELWRCGAIQIRRPGYKTVNCYYVPIDPAKCPSNLDAYLKRKTARLASPLASKKVGRGVVKLLGRRTRVKENQSRERPLFQPVQNIIQNIIHVQSSDSVETAIRRVDSPPQQEG